MVTELVCDGLFVARRGESLCEERSEEQDTNREGVASGGATYFFRLLKVIEL